MKRLAKIITIALVLGGCVGNQPVQQTEITKCTVEVKYLDNTKDTIVKRAYSVNFYIAIRQEDVTPCLSIAGDRIACYVKSYRILKLEKE